MAQKRLIQFLRPTSLLNSLRFSSTKYSNEPRVPDNSKCINKVILLGRCTSESIMKPLNNSHFTSFIMVTNELRRTKSNEIVKRSDFHKVYVYQPFLAKKAHDLIAKGTRLYVEGKLNYRRNENHYFTNIVAEKILFISGTNQQNDAAIADDDIEEIDEAFVNEQQQQQEQQGQQ